MKITKQMAGSWARGQLACAKPGIGLNFKFDRRSGMATGIASAVALGLWIWTRYPLWMLPAFAVAFALLSATTLRLDGILGVAAGAGLLYGGAWFSVYALQTIILEPDLMEKTKDSIWELNMLMVLIVYLVVATVLLSVRWTWLIVHSLCLVVALADYFVYQFRGNEIIYGDLTSLGTGATVAATYRYNLDAKGGTWLLLSILVIAAVFRVQIRVRSWVGRIGLRVLTLVLVLHFTPVVEKKLSRLVTQTWELKGTYKNGFLANFMLSKRDSKVKPPAGYSREAIASLEELAEEEPERTYQSQAGGAPAANEAANAAFEAGVKPVIITIMDESFADFRLIGDLQTNEEVTPFIDSLVDNTIRGSLLTSVYGAKTPNAEWEYLTGNTMAFLPGGSVPYQQYMQKNQTSLVSSLINQGYTAVAMHPYYKTGWSRNSVYPKMGFSELRFMDTGDFDEENILREYITDQELFDKIIDRYEAMEEDENLFIMSITMQNHGGYKNLYDNFDHDIYTTDGHYFQDANQYLSLIHETDRAVENLITYFREQERPVEIIFFGDHYPGLSNDFVKSLNGKGASGLTLTELEQLFSVPFFVWTNYDTQEAQVACTSMNYLSTIALERSGLEMPAYNQFLSKLRQVIPAMNQRGFWSESEGKYLHYQDAAGEEAEWIRRYRILQYNGLFDREDRSSLYFPYIE
ncbi:MAG: LTA synthase family protein [Lachnospiraceae bacterium]|nr:LTA synthase family protein [Lachnospiraceae bacterium]